MVVNLVGRPGLAVGQSRELFGVADEVLLLVAQAVVFGDHPGGQVDVSREIELVVGRQAGPVEVLRVSHPDVAPQEGAVQHGRVDAQLFVLVAQGKVGEVGFGPVDLARVESGPPPPAGSGAVVKVAQAGVLAQPTDDVQAHRAAHAIDEAGLGEVGVGGQVAAQRPAVIGLPGNELGVVVGQADVFVLPLGRSRRLDGIQVPGRALVHVDDRQQTHFQAPQALLGHPRPVLSQAGCLLAALGKVGRVKGQHEVARAVLAYELVVDGGEIDEPLEMVPHRALAVRVGVTGQLREIDMVANAHEQYEDVTQKLAAALAKFGRFGYYCVGEGLPFHRRVVVWMSDTQN